MSWSFTLHFILWYYCASPYQDYGVMLIVFLSSYYSPFLQISIGRTTKDNQVDVDLSLEGPSFKISRRQGAIKLRNSGEFILMNNGKRPMYVDGKPVLPNAKLKLHNNSVIEVSFLYAWGMS